MTVASLEDLRTGGCWFEPPARPIFFPRTHESHCNRIHSSLTVAHCFSDSYKGKHPVS